MNPDLELHRLLQATAVDPELLVRLQETPESVLDGYALRPEDRALLLAGDALPLEAVGRAIYAWQATQNPQREPAPAPPEREPTPSERPELPPVALTVQLVPQRTAAGAVQYAASLVPAEVPAPYTPPGDSPWGHVLSGEAVTQAAAAVRASTEEGRYEALLALLDAMDAR